MWKPAFSCVAIFLMGVAAPAQRPTATEVLARMTRVYATCRTYFDEGSIDTAIKGQTARKIPFRTALVRPDKFRFDVWLNGQNSPSGSSYIVWKEGEIDRSWTVSGGNERQFPLDTSLIRLAQVTGGTSVTVPQLLLPNLFRTMELLASLEDLKLYGEEKIDNHEMFKLEGVFAGQPVKLWIDKTDYLIWKIVRKVNLGPMSMETTVHYKPRIDSDIPPERVTFRPPSDTQLTATALPTSKAVLSPALVNPILRPRLRNFGSSLLRGPAEKAVPAGNSSANEDDVVRVETNLVTCAVLVVDPQGNIVRGLTREDFIVKEDTALQEVGSFSLGDNKDLPRSIVLIIDYSNSQLPYIRTSIEAAKTLVDKLNPKDRMALVTDDVKLLVDFTSDKELLKAQLENLKHNAISGKVGVSDQYDALMATFKELFDVEDIRPIIIFQTDGDELDSLKGAAITSPYLLKRKYSFEDLLTASEKARATVYSIIPGVQLTGIPQEDRLRRAKLDWANRQAATMEFLRNKNPEGIRPSQKEPKDEVLLSSAELWARRQTALSGLAKYTGAWGEFLEDPQQADDIYTRVLTDIDRRYVIGYYPTNRNHDGKRRKVNIEVRGHPEYVVWGQKTYFAREEK